MRYFAVMKDNSIKAVTNVTKQKSTGIVYFDVDDKMFRYLAFIDDYENIRYRRVLIPAYRIQQFIHEDWYESQHVDCLLSLDEEENEELNYFQSTDFNAGIMYTYVEKLAVHMINNKDKQVASTEIVLPKVQLVPKGCGGISEADTICATMNGVTEHFNAVYGKSFILEFGNCYNMKQHICFPFTITRKTEYKEMTIADIEKALGYKIKVVGSRDAD